MSLLDDLRREVRQKGERIARAAVVQMQGELKQATPVATGLLKSKTTVRIVSVGDEIRAEAVGDTEYAEALVRGRRAITITAKKPGGFLRFPDQGGVFIFRRSVNQKARAANPYWEEHMRRWTQYLQQAVARLR